MALKCGSFCHVHHSVVDRCDSKFQRCGNMCFNMGAIISNSIVEISITVSEWDSMTSACTTDMRDSLIVNGPALLALDTILLSLMLAGLFCECKQALQYRCLSGHATLGTLHFLCLSQPCLIITRE